MKKLMDPNRFVIGEKVKYVNPVTEQDLGLLEIQEITDEFIVTSRLFSRSNRFKFTRDGRATWSSNLSIQHAP